MNGTTRRWSPPSAGCAARAGASRCCSTTRTTARSATPRPSAPSTSTAMTACWPSARRWRRSIAAGAGADRVWSGTRPPTSGLFHPPGAGRARAKAWSGSAIGATASAARRSRPSCCARRRDAGLPLDIHGVRYPPSALGALAESRRTPIRGWLPNARAPEVFARHLATVHVPRRFYVTMLPGIPTIRVFEALACGIPLVSAPWQDSEGLFRPGRGLSGRPRRRGDDRHLRALRQDDPDCAPPRARAWRRSAPATAAPTGCDELLAILAQLAPAST
jgi:hypothetical protein